MSSVDASATTVLVTGGSGFVGSHCVHQLLEQGYNVRTTIRSLKREDEVRKLVTPKADPSAASRLTVYAADLSSDDGWEKAIDGCDYVLHVASPFPVTQPKDANELIRPAVDGTLRVLKASLAKHVKRVVMTSSFVAVGYGHDNYDRVLDENDWSNPEGKNISPYGVSKTLAERAAWDFVEKNPGLEFTVMNPVGIFGPVLGAEAGRSLGTSMQIIERIVKGQLPAAPRMVFGVVDVRDLATLHIRAMHLPEAKGKRFLCISDNGEFVSIQEIGKALGHNVRTLPDWLVRGLAYISSDLKMVTFELGADKHATNKRTRETFGFTFKGWEESVKASADSLKELGLV
jgi:dihydroflavonol-4-reductase